MSLYFNQNNNNNQQSFQGRQFNTNSNNKINNNNSYNSNNNSNMNSQNQSFVGGQQQQQQYNSNNPNERRLSTVYISQLLKAAIPGQDENLMIDGVEIKEVQIIGIVQSMNVQSSFCLIQLFDESGSIQVKVWFNDDDKKNLKMIEKIKENCYAKVFGRVNIYQGNISINAHKVLSISDMNEITLHSLQCIYRHLSLTKSNNKNNQNNNKNNNQNPNAMMNNNNNNFNNNFNNNNNKINSFGNSFEEEENDDLPGLQSKIKKIMLQIGDSETGVDINEIFKRLPNENIDELRSGVEEMSTNGVIYTTVDEEHFKLTSY